MNNPILNFLAILAIGALVILILCAIVAWLAIRQLRRFVSPNVDRLQERADRLAVRYPNQSAVARLRRIVHGQAIRCGLVGAITGLGGFVTFPIALPIDLILSMRIQATMVQFIALSYGQSPASSAGLRLQTRLITSGSLEVSERTFSFIMKLIGRLLGESLSILIPAIGAIVGFIVNYAIAEATGQLALRWYSSQFGGKIQSSDAHGL